MKKQLLFVIISIVLLSIKGLYAQPGIPLKENGSVLFGKDIVISDNPLENQRSAVICSAFNGWLFASYGYDSLNVACQKILRSTDNGLTWSVLFHFSDLCYGRKMAPVDILVCGDDISNLFVFTATILIWDTIGPGQKLYIQKMNGQTGEIYFDWFEEDIVYLGGEMGTFDGVSLATDNSFPAQNAAPFSLGLLYSKHKKVGNFDSLIFRSSSNGAVSLDQKQVIATSRNVRYGKVDLAYGYSPSKNSGRYFATWEQRENSVSQYGHIYTAHTEPNFNSPFVKPVCLDSLDGSLINNCRKPVIALQSGNFDNDSSNMTEVIVFEKFSHQSNTADLMGYYNLQSAGSGYFKKANIAVTQDNEIEPDISFNQFSRDFYVTYFDSTSGKLPLVTKDINMNNPDIWTTLSSGYNDLTNLIAPNPKVNINPIEEKSLHTWIAENQSGNGMAMFDAEYSTYTGVSKNNESDVVKLFGVFPTPCKTNVSFAFELNESQNVLIRVYDLLGRPISTIADRVYPAGTNTISYDVSGLQSGSYLYSITVKGYVISGKIVVN